MIMIIVIFGRVYMLSLKYDIKEIPIELPYRKQGNSKMKIKHILGFL